MTSWKIVVNEDKKTLTIRRLDDGVEVPKDESEFPMGTPEEVPAVPEGTNVIIDRDVDNMICAIGITSDEPMEVGVTP